jgi:ADP-ribose pyrophosphatase
MRIVEDVVELPNGEQMKYLRSAPGMGTSVAVIALNDKGELLVQREYSYPPDEVMYQLPGGGVENGEELEFAANRELSEESGYVAENVEMIGSFYSSNRRSDARQHVAVCTGLSERSLPKDAEEFIESEWMSFARVRELVAAGEIVNMNMLAALQLFDAQQS